MLDGLLGRGLASKCKSSIKLTRTRIEVITRKRNATQRFLKKDIADLLANGLDINAYGRAEGLLAELRLSSCYDFVEQFCDCILKHLSVMQKLSACPEECRMAVSSLMFAAARFSDLPELRDLRQIFQERYGTSLEHFVNQEFVENLASKPPEVEKKVKLMQDIASEFSIKWDHRAFELRTSKPPASPLSVLQDQRSFGAADKYKLPDGKDNKYRSANGKDGNYNVLNGKNDKYKFPDGNEAVSKTDKPEVSPKERFELTNRRYSNVPKGDEVNPQFSEKLLDANKQKSLDERKSASLKTGNHDSPFRGTLELGADLHESWKGKEEETAVKKPVRLGSLSHKKSLECIDGRYKLYDDRENTISVKDDREPWYVPSGELTVKSQGKEIQFSGSNNDDQPKTAIEVSKVREEVADGLKPHFNNLLPPPYVKPKHGKRRSHSSYKNDNLDCIGALADPSNLDRADAGSRLERIQAGSDHPADERKTVEPVMVDGHIHEKDHYQEKLNRGLLPKRRSARRRPSKSVSSQGDLEKSEDAGVVKKNSSTRRRDHSRRGIQFLSSHELYHNDDEERMIDKLLLHYSRKPSTYEPEKLRRKSVAHSLLHMASDAREVLLNGSTSGPEVNPKMVTPPGRSISFPHEQIAPSEPKKVLTRAASFQPDLLNPARHVHPKLPDYDDLAAQFAALRGM